MSVMRRVVMAALLFAAILTGSWAVAVTAWAFNGDKNKPPSLADRVATLEKRLAEVERQCGCQCAPKQASPTTQPAKKTHGVAPAADIARRGGESARILGGS